MRPISWDILRLIYISLKNIPAKITYASLRGQWVMLSSNHYLNQWWPNVLLYICMSLGNKHKTSCFYCHISCSEACLFAKWSLLCAKRSFLGPLGPDLGNTPTQIVAWRISFIKCKIQILRIQADGKYFYINLPHLNGVVIYGAEILTEFHLTFVWQTCHTKKCSQLAWLPWTGFFCLVLWVHKRKTSYYQLHQPKNSCSSCIPVLQLSLLVNPLTARNTSVHGQRYGSDAKAPNHQHL